MNQIRKITVEQLRREEAELLRQLLQVRKALSVVEGDSQTSDPLRPPSRAELLKRYLVEHPEGVRVSSVPALLKLLGHVSIAAHETTNWVYQSKDYFSTAKGIVTLRSIPAATSGDDASNALSSNGANAASTGGVKPSDTALGHKEIRGTPFSKI